MATERLLLRPFTLEDMDGVHQEIYSDPEVLRYYSGKGVRTREETLQHVTEHLACWREEELGRHAVMVKATGAFVGQVQFNSYVNSFARGNAEPSPDYNTIEVELAFAFGRRFLGQGYAYEACTALIHYAFGDLRLRRLVGNLRGPNIRTRNLHQRLGYHIERYSHWAWWRIQSNPLRRVCFSCCVCGEPVISTEPYRLSLEGNQRVATLYPWSAQRDVAHQ